jgi:hypothetical protein
MNKLPMTIMECSFDILYLATVWILVALMAKGRKRVAETDRPLAGLFLLAFALLASGDSFHVGARVLTALIGPDRALASVGGVPSTFIGLGSLATAYTMTGFYMALAMARKTRSGAKADAAFWIMEILLGLRLVIMALPGNAWERSVAPYGMGLLRNLPLALAGFLMAVLFIFEGRRDKERAWEGIGWSMLASYAFYTPVILFVAKLPLLGLLMIPKTIAYVIMGIIVYRRYWGGKAKAA